MRYIYAIFIVSVLLVVALAGFRGSTSRQPPLEVFPDMDRQPKLDPQSQSAFFADGLSSRLPVPGTIARGVPHLDLPLHTGRVPGTTNFVEINPLPITEKLLQRGRERYQINCSPCHGSAGDAQGITTKFGMLIIANLHEQRIVAQPDGEIFNTITHGKNTMGAYGPNILEEDRWAIIAYLRALQLSRLATVEDVPAAMRSQFTP